MRYMGRMLGALLSSMSKILNAAEGKDLVPKATQRKVPPFKVKARPMGLQPGIDETSFNKLVGELEAAEYLTIERMNERSGN